MTKCIARFYFIGFCIFTQYVIVFYKKCDVLKVLICLLEFFADDSNFLLLKFFTIRYL